MRQAGAVAGLVLGIVALVALIGIGIPIAVAALVDADVTVGLTYLVGLGVALIWLTFRAALTVSWVFGVQKDAFLRRWKRREGESGFNYVLNRILQVYRAWMWSKRTYLESKESSEGAYYKNVESATRSLHDISTTLKGQREEGDVLYMRVGWIMPSMSGCTFHIGLPTGGPESVDSLKESLEDLEAYMNDGPDVPLGTGYMRDRLEGWGGRHFFRWGTD